MTSSSAFAWETVQVVDGRVRLRSNVVATDDAWHLVPGEVVAEWRPDLMRQPSRPTQLQIDERMYYVPCSVCRRTINLIMREGCGECSHGPTPRQLEEARDLHRHGLDAVQRARRALLQAGGEA